MQLTNKYRLDIKTNKNLGDEQFSKGFLEAWIDGQLDFCPMFFGHGEPIRNPIADVGVAGVLREWQTPPSLMFKRTKSPKYVAEIKWRANKGKDPRQYPWGVIIWLDLKSGDDFAIKLLKFMISWFDPVFASLTTIEEAKHKHFVSYPYYKKGRQIGIAERYVGTDVTETFPGIYWVTYFGSNTICADNAARLDEDLLISVDGGGRLILAHSQSTQIGTDTARMSEQQIVDVIGPEKFFDVAKWTQPGTEEKQISKKSLH